MAEAEGQSHSKTDESSKAMKLLWIVILETEH